MPGSERLGRGGKGEPSFLRPTSAEGFGPQTVAGFSVRAAEEIRKGEASSASLTSGSDNDAGKLSAGSEVDPVTGLAPWVQERFVPNSTSSEESLPKEYSPHRTTPETRAKLSLTRKRPPAAG